MPAVIVKQIIEEWKHSYGPTYPLYGPDSVRNDISGSVSPLQRGTELAHEKILAERSGVSKRTIDKIMGDEVEWLKHEQVDRLLAGMNRNDCWTNELEEWY